MLYRILLFSAKYQHEPAIGMHMSPPSWTSLPSPSPFHQSRLLQSPCLSSLSDTANSHWLSVLHVVIRFPCYSLHTFHPLFLPPHTAVSVSLFCIAVSSLLPCKWIHQYHLSRYHIYALVGNIYLSLTSLCIICCRFIHSLELIQMMLLHSF